MNFIFHSASARRVLSLAMAITMLLSCALTASATEFIKEEDIVAPEYVTSVSDMVPSDRTTVIQNVNSVILPGCVKEGYVFLGWNTSASGTGTHYNVGDTYIVDGMQTLYGEWRKLESGTDDVDDSDFDSVNSTDYVQNTANDRIPGFTVSQVGPPDMDILNQQAYAAAPSGTYFDCWHITTDTADQYVYPDFAADTVYSICGYDTPITLVACYLRDNSGGSAY